VHLVPGQRFGRIQVLEDGTLEIGNVQIQDEGVYTCIATNNMNQSRMSNTSLSVMYPPIIVNMSSDTTATKNTKITLQCEVKGKPMPTVTWIAEDDIQIKHTEIMTKDGMHYLNITRVRNTHEGKFTCEAKNKLGSARKELFLNVKGKNDR
jgi:hemicentin